MIVETDEDGILRYYFDEEDMNNNTVVLSHKFSPVQGYSCVYTLFCANNYPEMEKLIDLLARGLYSGDNLLKSDPAELSKKVTEMKKEIKACNLFESSGKSADLRGFRDILDRYKSIIYFHVEDPDEKKELPEYNMEFEGFLQEYLESSENQGLLQNWINGIDITSEEMKMKSQSLKHLKTSLKTFETGEDMYRDLKLPKDAALIAYAFNAQNLGGEIF